MRDNYGHIRDTAISLASRPEGMCNASFKAATGIGNGSAGSRIARLCRLGYIHKAAATGRKLRWFDTQERADAYVVAHGGQAGESHQARNARLRAKDAPVTIKARSQAAWSAGEADTSRARRIVCPAPSHDARYQVAPGEHVAGGFETMGVGRYL